ncbi:MAG: DegT/DnrJ/EryC1/StrS family aminotransferase [Magnetococcales bacterium]|nr:DegT/DnrJ/EryC1/StrS family aminotransferase [Magnetococcales bacterium]
MTTPRETIPWFQLETGEAEGRAVAEVMASGYLNDGAVARQLERSVADLLGTPHAVAVTSGTAALALALMAVGVGPGDEVIVPDLTFVATANAVRLAGAEVVLVDVDPHRFALDPERAEAAITRRTRALLPVDVNGRGADYVALEEIARRHGLALVSDACEGLGSRWQGKPLGSFGDAGCFSFSANKTVSSGQGGMIALHDEGRLHRLRELKDQGRRAGGTGGADLHPVMGYNFKYTNLQAAVALAQWDRLAARLDLFRQREQWYREFLGEVPGVCLPPWDEAGGEIPQWTDILVEDRAKVEAALAAQGMGSRGFWLPLHRQAPYRRPDDDFGGALEVSRKGLWLPSSFSLTREQARRVAEVVRTAVA